MAPTSISLTNLLFSQNLLQGNHLWYCQLREQSIMPSDKMEGIKILYHNKLIKHIMKRNYLFSAAMR